MNSVVKIISVIMLASTVIGCSSMDMSKYLPDKKVDYQKKTNTAGHLEVPPDLSDVSDVGKGGAASGRVITSYSDYVAGKGKKPEDVFGGRVLPEMSSVRVVREGDDRWLELDSEVDDVWSRVVDFWQESGILLLEQDPSIGVMRTDWLENRANIKNDLITDFIRGVFDGLYEASTRDQYRVRLERGVKSGTTELFLTHFGMEEEYYENSGGDSEQGVWVITGRDRGLEAEMLRRLMVHLGIEDAKATQQLATDKVRQKARTRSDLVKSLTGVKLLIDEPASRAWRLVGLSLDRVGFPVEDRDRSKGIYYVRYNDPAADIDEDKGWFSRLKFWEGDKNVDKVNRYQVVVQPGRDKAEVIVNNEQGTRDNSGTALRILTLIHEQMR